MIRKRIEGNKDELLFCVNEKNISRMLNLHKRRRDAFSMTNVIYFD